MGVRCVFILVLLVHCCPFPSLAITRYVWTNSPSPGAPYTTWNSAAHTIQEAIDVSAADDVVLVTNGIYRTGGRAASGHVLTNRVLLNQAVDVRSINGPTRTIIEGSGPLGLNAVRCLFITNSAGMSGFTLWQGHTINDGAPGTGLDKHGGGAILFSGGMLSNCIVSHCEAADFGGGCYITGHAYLVNCEIMTNEAVEGGGLYSIGGSVRDCSFIRNAAVIGNGGGAYTIGGRVFDCQFATNNGYCGGGLYMENGTFASNLLCCYNTGGSGIGVYMKDCTLLYSELTENHGNSVGGGLAAIDSVARDCIILSNGFEYAGEYEGATSFGGGVYCRSSTVENCTIMYNRTRFTNDIGGGVYCRNEGTFINCNIQENQSANGGGIGIESNAVLTLLAVSGEYCRVYDNVASNYGGGVFARNGGLIVSGLVIIAYNEATYGGGIAAVQQSAILFDCLEEDVPTLYCNTAHNSGGGFYAQDTGTVMDIRNTVLGYRDPSKGPRPNWALGAIGGGGGILLLNGASMTGCNLRIEYNEAPQAAGGGILVSHAQLHLRAEYNPLLCATTAVSYLRHNEATNSHGGAIHAQDEAVIRVEQMVLANNAALRGGGAYIASGSTAEFYNVVFSSNLASVASGALRVYGSGSRADLRHVTAAGNTTGGIETAAGGWVCLTNCIVAAHPGVNLTAGNEAGYSDIEGGYPGTGNVNYDPNLDRYDSLQLRPTLYSVGDVVDMGTPAGVTNDLLGRPRPINSVYDMGAYEYAPSRDDYDGDGMADGWETNHTLNPVNPADGPIDSDGDGIPNDEEFMADTDPHDIDAFFQLDDIYRSEIHPERGVTACFTSSADRCYSLQSSDQPADNQWDPIAGQVLIHGTGGPDGLYDTNELPHRLYRVSVGLPAP